MTTTAWSWLPDGALSAPAVLGLIDDAVDAWSRRWFPDYRLRRQRQGFAGGSTTHPVAAATPRLSLRASSPSLDVLAGRVLDVDLARLELGDGDRTVIDALRDELAQDLAQGLDTALTGQQPRDGSAADVSGSVLIELADDEGRRLLMIETSRAILADVRRKVLPGARPGGDRLTSLRAAVGHAPVKLSASVGSSVILLSEARRLAPGDVIVLDRKLDQPIDIVAGPGDTGLACARMVDAASPRSLRLQAVANRDSR